MARMLALAQVVSGLVIAGSAGAWGGIPPPVANAGAPIILRLDGVVTVRSGRVPHAFTVLSLGFAGRAGTSGWFAVIDARTVGADPGLLGKDVLDALTPLQPNLIVAGQEGLVALLRDATPDTRLRVEGLVLRGSRTYFLRSVEPLSAPPPAP